MTMTAPLGVRLPTEDREALSRQAAAAGKGASTFAREAVQAALNGGIWVAYYPSYVSAAHAVPFATEVEALRYALDHHLMKVRYVPYGADLYQET